MSIFSKFYFRPDCGEQVQVTLTVAGDSHAAVCGTVTDHTGCAVQDAIVILYACDTADPQPIAGLCTDDDGQFVFGPLEGGKLYMVKVFHNDLQVREMKIGEGSQIEILADPTEADGALAPQ
ncbi:MAG: carboxypeptidase-like regulatory domain-containing protein [Oscillospiraceae bacterium]|jgi:hypothetical protein